MVENTKKKMNGVLKAFLVLLIIAALAAGGVYAVKYFIIDIEAFPNETTINGVDVSGLSVPEACDKITEAWNSHTMLIQNEEDEILGQIDSANLSYDLDEAVEACLHPGIEESIIRTIRKSQRIYQVEMHALKNTKKFKKQVENLDMVKNYKSTKKSVNAYVDLSSDHFNVVKEEVGDELDLDKLKEAMYEGYQTGESFVYDAPLYYIQPEITTKSQEIKDQLDYCEKYLSQRIEYKGAFSRYVIPPSYLDKLKKVSADGKVTIDREFADTLVYDLAMKFNTVGIERELKSRGGGKYTVSGGDYGYIVDHEGELEQLIKDLESNQDVKRAPVYSQKGSTKGKNMDIGKTYVEVSLSAQTLWLVVDGKEILSTYIVSGNPYDGHGTYTGVFYIKYKATNVTLKGRNNDGSKYESKVRYWMPFYGDQGLHDADWRGAFGGGIYLGGGSHGCVNMPVGVTPTVFANVEVGTPVIVHN